MTRRFVTALLAASLSALPAAADAHLVNTGTGPIYDGIAHLFVSFEDLLPVVALALLAGLNGPQAGRRVLFTLPLAWWLGGLAGRLMMDSLVGSLVLSAPLPAGLAALALLATGGLLAADVHLTAAVTTTLALLLGGLKGGLSGLATGADQASAMALVGTVAAVFVVVALVAGLVVAMKRPWMRVGVRASGSWIAASGLLLLGWTLSGRA
jgi:hypothetical protein